MILYTLVLSLLSCVYCNKKPPSLNEYDTYNADECQRVRRPWHKLSTEERDLYISGLLQLRNNGNGDIDNDELINIGSVHEDTYAPFIHKTSSYLFWHGYLTWELESRIRNLGGKYRCFGMPYWDFTLESGREDHPLIFETDIGGNGDPDDHWTVNEYSWTPPINQYWVPNNCVAQNDEYPLCSLKRALRDGFTMPSSQLLGDAIINNPNFIDFASYSHLSGQAIHLIDDHPDTMEPFPQSYEPIWYLFHSFIQYHQAIWVDCNDYDLINVDDLQKHPEAFQSFCYSDGSCSGRYPQEWTGWDLDSPMHFGGSLPDKEWSYIHNNDLTVRKSYMLPKWNIIYDLGDSDDFYTTSGIAQYCEGKLNNHWFILNEEEQETILSSSSISYLHFDHEASYLWIAVVILVCVAILYLVKKPKKKIYPKKMMTAYGSV